MSFPELLAKIQSLKVAEKRAQEAAYLEVVVERDFLAPVCKVLADYFGQPLKPEGEPASKEADRLAGPYGGIHENQTMYCRQDREHDEYAFLWPWGNGIRVTVKIIQAKSSGSAGGGKGFLGNIFGPK